MTESDRPWHEAMTGRNHASLAKLTTIVYALQAASLLVGFSIFAGVIINYVRREDVSGTWLESHFRWQIRTFWFWLVWMAVGGITAIFIIGWFVIMGASVWLIYRIVKGWLYLTENREMPT